MGLKVAVFVLLLSGILVSSGPASSQIFQKTPKKIKLPDTKPKTLKPPAAVDKAQKEATAKVLKAFSDGRTIVFNSPGYPGLIQFRTDTFALKLVNGQYEVTGDIRPGSTGAGGGSDFRLTSVYLGQFSLTQTGLKGSVPTGSAPFTMRGSFVANSGQRVNFVLTGIFAFESKKITFTGVYSNDYGLFGGARLKVTAETAR
jgi:hypothetical protein